jgi:chromosome segregation ATPase
MKITVTRSIDAAEAAAIRKRLAPYEATRRVGDAPAGSQLAQLNAAVIEAPARVTALEERAARLREALAGSETALAAAEAGDAFLEIATRQAEASAIRERLAAVEAEAVKARDQATAALEAREHAWSLICSARTALAAIASDSSAFMPHTIARRQRYAWDTLEALLDPIAADAAAA